MAAFTAAVTAERWPLRETFTISRGSRNTAEVVTVTLSDPAGTSGRGECAPYRRYGETVAGVTETITAAAAELPAAQPWDALQEILPPGAARNALDCALWDWRARRENRPAWQLAGLAKPQPVVSAFTLSLAEPKAMAEAAARARGFPVLKLKLGAGDPAACVAAVKKAAPAATLIADANEAWRADTVAEILRDLAALGVAMVEQPLPAGDDQALAAIAKPRPVAIAADESFHTAADTAAAAVYDIANIKLDKTGGLTAALTAAAAIRRRGLKIMVGCMPATSLSTAPAHLLTAGAAWVDLDAPLLLADDRPGAMRWDGGTVQPPAAGFWGA
ncbi:MAG: dipeptide epimerase [Gammaproteobacteria bacterium]|nr:dipeptide epimerase [Gammaproteobacteria bacterium]